MRNSRRPHNARRRVSLGFVASVLLGTLVALPRGGSAATTWSAELGVGSVHGLIGPSAALRGALSLDPADSSRGGNDAARSVGLLVRGGLIDQDVQRSFSMAVNVSLSYRARWDVAWGGALQPFWGAVAGVGLWTACVSSERCGGFGPSVGGELGIERQIGWGVHGFSVLRGELQTGLFGPQPSIFVATWMVGVRL